MSVKARSWVVRLLCLALAGTGSLAADVEPAGANPLAQAAAVEYFKYYVVVRSEYQGEPENLTDIAVRLLGAANRASDIYNLNVDRRQPDGGALGADQKLRAGWSLVLPWDAVGDGVQYGALPTAAPAPKPSASPGPRPANTPRTPPSQPDEPETPAAPSPTKSAERRRDTCTATQPPRSQSDWARRRMAVDQAWERTQGEGVLVAVIDSGVDAGVPQLAGRVTLGADVVNGSGRGDVDCLGSGTAMASILAAWTRSGESPAPRGDGGGADVSEVVGMAPAATILPIRVVADVPRSRPEDSATAIEVAVSAGAKVIALGSYVDVSDESVARAIALAWEHDVVVVAAAVTEPPQGASAQPVLPASTGVLWVGGVGPEGQAVANYRSGQVDVTAPGIDVPSLGVGDNGIRASSGSQYAVAAVAGLAALVRSAFPHLDAGQVAHRIKATADGGDGVPDSTHGFGMINPTAAVTLELAVEATAPPPAPAAGPGTLRLITIGLLVLLCVLALGLVIWRIGARIWATGPRNSTGAEPASPVVGVVRISRPSGDSADTSSPGDRGTAAGTFDGRASGRGSDEGEPGSRGAGGTEWEAAGSAGPGRPR